MLKKGLALKTDKRKSSFGCVLLSQQKPVVDILLCYQLYIYVGRRTCNVCLHSTNKAAVNEDHVMLKMRHAEVCLRT